MTKVLITGGAGFIGYHLATSLVECGYQVDLLDDLSRGVRDGDLESLTKNPAVRLLPTDLAKPEALDDLGDDYNYIYHLASIIGVTNVRERPIAVIRDNVAMLGNLLAFARTQRDLRRLLFASTSEVYAGTLNFFDLPIPTPESTPLTVTELSEPRTSYMLAKICGEALCNYSDIPWTIIRPHNVYGPRMGMAHVIPQLLDRTCHAEGDSLEVYSVDHRRTFCYISDAVGMIRSAAESAACARETLNIGNQTPEITIRELVEVIFDVTGRRLEVIAKAPTPGSPARRCPDMSKTLSLTGYTPQVGLEAGVRLTYEWYDAHVFSGEGVTAN